MDLNYAHMIQLFNRFLLDHFSSEGNYFPNNPILLQGSRLGGDPSALIPAAAPVTQLLGIDAKNIITCMNCKATREKENMTHLLDLSYPRPSAAFPDQLHTQPNPDFAHVVRSSLLRQIHHKATCQTCKRFANFSTKRSIPSRDLPPILSVNACVYNEETQSVWLDRRKERFLSPTLELAGQVEGHDQRDTAKYEVRALVVKIVGKNNNSHLVAIIKGLFSLISLVTSVHTFIVPEAEGRSDIASPWFVFNDFMVNNISEDEALSFPDKWKVRYPPGNKRSGLTCAFRSPRSSTCNEQT